ncbi:MAG: hypothetical protein V1885_00080 [Candidatus Brennerbacteria bacterium]
MSSKSSVIALFVILAAIAVLGVFAFIGGEPKQVDAAVVELAQCLAGKGAIMYGTKTCPYCRAEKAAFGEAFQYISYVECTEEPNRCVEAKVEGVPLWTFSDGTRLEGKQGLEGLARAASCPYVPKD